MKIPDDKLQHVVVELLRFSAAWKALVAATSALPDLDVSELYPFFILDFEAIQPAVEQWCKHHASKLLRQIPDKVPNPACAYCPHVLDGLNEAGMCKGMSERQCNMYPIVHYDRALLTPFCQAEGIDTTGLSDESMQLQYTRKVKEIYEKANKTSDIAESTQHSDYT